MHRNKAGYLIKIRQSTGLVSARTCIERQSEIQKRYELERGRGGEEDHVAIPTVTYTNNLMYHLKAEEALFF